MTITAKLSNSLSGICQVTRLIAVVWLLWELVQVTLFWADGEQVTRAYSHRAGMALAPMTTAQHAGSYALVLVSWLAGAVLVCRIWQLFGHYLRGDVLSPESAASLTALGWTGFAVIAVDLMVRPLVFAVVTGGKLYAWLVPNDLLHILMALFVTIVGAVLATGAAIAEENRQII